MSTAPKQTTPATPARDKSTVYLELEAARARFRELQKQVEADNAKKRRCEAVIDAARQNHRRQFSLYPDVVFDESAFPRHTPDEALQVEFHGLHYSIASLEAEYAAQSAIV